MPARAGFLPSASCLQRLLMLVRLQSDNPRLNGRVDPMKWGKYRFGSIKIDGKAYGKDVVLDRGACESGRRSPRAHIGSSSVTLPSR